MKRLITVLVIGATMLAIASPAQATFPGKNGRIAFRRALADNWAAIFTINPDGTRERQLTHPPRGRWTTEPNWSSNGRWIVYDVWRNADQDNARILKVRANGTHRTYLGASCTAPCLTDSFPAWSPDGQRIAFGRGLGPSIGTNNVGAIFIMRADGTHPRQITQVGADPTVMQPYADDDPTWSPDGKLLVFQRVRERDGRHAIFTVRPDGNGLRRLTPWRLDAASPDWSPNGRWVAFRTYESSDTRGDIGLVRPNGLRRHLITSGRGKWGLLSFSPDGRRIAATFNDDVYAMRVDGTGVRVVVHTKASEGIPGWGPRPK